MKLQQFIQNYRLKSHSPQSPYIFRTSESVGTLASHDQQCTDRSFVVRESLPLARPFQTNNYEDCQEVARLKDLCESQRGMPNTGKYLEMETNSSKQLEAQQFGPQKHCLKPSLTPFFSKLRDRSVSLSTFNRESQSIVMTPTLNPKEQQQSNDLLYEQAPSAQYNPWSHPQVQLINSIQKQQSSFLQIYEELLNRVVKLQQQNLLLQSQWLQQSKLSIKYEQMQNNLTQQLQHLKQSVKTTIEENIHIENLIKQELLKQEIQKYRYFTESNQPDNNTYSRKNQSGKRKDGQLGQYRNRVMNQF